MAWFSSWTRAQRLVITVPSGTVAPLSYLPVVLTAASLPTELTNNTCGRSDGGDLAFAADLGVGNSLSSIGAQIPCEVVSASFGGTPAAEIHVQVPSVAATGTLTYIWVLYGNSGQTAQPAAGSTYGSQEVWNENGTQNFAGIWHLGQTGTGNAGDYPDSTSNANASVNTTLQPAASAGEVGGGQTFATNHLISVNNSASTSLGTSWTYEFWGKIATTVAVSQFIGNIQNLSTGRVINLYWNASHFQVDIPYVASIKTSVATYTDFNWRHYAVTRSGSTWTIYINGALDSTATNATAQETPSAGAYLQMGYVYYASGNTASLQGGALDEVRISATPRSASWVAASYSNQSAPGTFIAPPSGQGPIWTGPYAYSASGLGVTGGYGGSSLSWVHVQGTSAVGTSLTFASPVTAGNLIVVSVSEYNGSSTTITCKDSKNNVNYTQVAQVSNSGNQVAVLWYIPPVGGTPFTVIASNAYYAAMTIDEYSMPVGATGLVIDSFGSDNTGAKTLASSLTVTGDDLIYAACAVNSGTVNAGSGFNLRGQVAYVYSVDIGITSEDQLNVTSNINPTFAAGGGIQAMIGVAFKPLLPFTFNAAGLSISGVFGGSGASAGAGAGGLAISGVYGGANYSLLAPLTGLAISGSPGITTGGPAPGVAGLPISGVYGGAVFPGIISPATGMPISGHPGTGTAGPAPGAAGMPISGGPGGNPSLTVTVSISGLAISGYTAGTVGGEYLGPFYLPYEYTSVPIETGNTNPFGIDPERTVVITTGLTYAD